MYKLRLAMPGGPMLPRKAAFLIGHSSIAMRLDELDFTNVKS
jgi:hypothetical protein